MTFPKLLAIMACVLFGIIGIAAMFKNSKESPPQIDIAHSVPLEIELDQEIRTVASAPKETPPTAAVSPAAKAQAEAELPDANRINELFNKIEPRLPIVQTITYKSRVPWQKGRPAWLSDYAAHFTTSRHFIARSLNGKPDYLKQDIAEGDRFNVLHPDKKINFYLLIDISRSKMWFYYLDMETNERVLLKTYMVGLGKIDSSKPSGMLTPLGKYTLGNKIAIYKPKLMGFHNGKKTEMIRVFGTRWIPFGQEIGESTAAPNGFGIHGVSWLPNGKGELVEDIGSIGRYASDGCVCLSTADMEELFAVIITRPTTIELVKDFYEARLPGTEEAKSPSVEKG